MKQCFRPMLSTMASMPSMPSASLLSMQTMWRASMQSISYALCVEASMPSNYINNSWTKSVSSGRIILEYKLIGLTLQSNNEYHGNKSNKAF